MTNSSNSHSEMTGTSIGYSETTAETATLPDNYNELAAFRAAADAKMQDLRTTRGPLLKAKWEAEATEAGLTVDEVLHGIANEKKRGRGRRTKET